jgi:sialic acid synthase SpsE
MFVSKARDTMNGVYVIGEIGQNHNGSVDIAKLITEVAARPVQENLFHLTLRPMDAVKMTKRDLKEELSKSQMDRPYNSAHSFGATYGEHREFLELTDEEHFEVYKHAKSLGLQFVETLCAVGCLSILKLFTPDRLKVASRDLTNLPLLNALAETKIPIILSTGMAGKKELDDAIAVVSKYHNEISILHCVSEYPTQPQNVNLNTIRYLQKHYSQFTIGYSDHTIGIATPVAAVAMGAQIIEKHITLDRNMKGTDQAGSLGIDGMNRMMRDIRMLEMQFGVEDIFISEGVNAAKVKLERSIATKRELKAGEVIAESDLHMLSPGDGYKWADVQLLIGKKVNVDIPADEIIYPSMLSE